MEKIFSEVKGDVQNQVADDEILVILGPAPNRGREPWVEDLRKKGIAALKKTLHYATFHFGFLNQAGSKPYVVVDFDQEGANSLERRWIMNLLVRHVVSEWAVNRIAVYLEAGSGASELAMIEDFISYRSTPLFEQTKWQSIRVLSPELGSLQEKDPHGEIRWRYNWSFRQWVNANPDEMTSLEIGARLRQFAAQHDCSMESLEVPELTDLGLNLLVAVGQASDLSPSRLHLLSHNPKGSTAQPLLLVGKGITFDTGGINLKPHESFVNCMKNDMGGAALMSNLFMALVESGYDQPLCLAIPSCENLIAQKAMKPGAIVKSYSGKKVIIEHTDAEGRLILADAIPFAQKKFNPRETWVAATLTTAALRQFSSYITPVHFASKELAAAIDHQGAYWGEVFTHWGSFLPFLKGNQTNAADLTNMGRLPANANSGGGSNVAAHFLKEFTQGPMVHFDIFASTWNWSNDYPGAHYGATGAPFNTLFSTIRSSST